MCLNRFDTDTKTAFLDLYTKVDAEATAPVASSDILDGVKVTTSREISTDDLIVTVSLDGNNRETRLSVSEIEDFRNQGLTLEQIVDRTAKTLARVLDRDIPF